MYGVEFRPLDFNSVYGLDVYKDLLKASLREKQYAAAYLFSGSHSSGKTSLARVFARAILCENPKEDYSPCNACKSCADFLKDRHPGYMEIDAANNAGKDQIKNINESLSYESEYGIRIIVYDEAHDISRDGKDALLKQLEKNNSNVIMIFCTTELSKMPQTILSRCFALQLPDPTEEHIVNKLQDICSIKKKEYDKDALYAIVRATGRHYRDAENKLDMISLLGDISLENVSKVAVAYDCEIINLLYYTSTDLQKAIELGNFLSSRMNIKDIYMSVLRIINDAIAISKGIKTGSQVYNNDIENLSKFYGESLFEILDYILSKDKLNDMTVFQSDLLLLHYKHRKGDFKIKRALNEKSSAAVTVSEKDPGLRMIKEASNLPPWERDQVVRRVKNELKQKENDTKVKENVSKSWGPEIKDTPSEIRKKVVSQSEFTSIIGEAFDEGKI